MNKVKYIFEGLIASFILTITFVLFFSLLLVKTNINENVTNGVIIVISSMSILIGSSISTIKFKKNGWISGALLSIMYMIIIYIISSLANNNFELNKTSVFMILFGIILGVVGGIIGVNIKK